MDGVAVVNHDHDLVLRAARHSAENEVAEDERDVGGQEPQLCVRRKKESGNRKHMSDQRKGYGDRELTERESGSRTSSNIVAAERGEISQGNDEVRGLVPRTACTHELRQAGAVGTADIQL